jgi:GrpB-like predicted nucleotidyltransferase (UPF0157 family)
MLGGVPEPTEDVPHHLDEELDRVLVGGRRPARPVIADYDPGWPARYEHERARIAAALGERALRLEHVGSTAVPGLPAKDVIDVCLAVADPEDEAAYVPLLEPLGLAVRVREPRHRMLGRPAHDVNLHVYAPDDPEIEGYLLLRGWLRTHPQDRDRYAALKRRLAGREWPDMNYYAEAKGPLIRELLARARASA